MSLVGLLVIWPAMGKGPMALLGRASAVFLGKLSLVVLLVLWMHGKLGTDGGNRFGISLGLTVVLLLLAQGALLAWRSNQLAATGAETKTEAVDNS